MSTLPPLFEPIEAHHVPIEPLLRTILERCEADRAFVDALDACAFQPYPSLADDIDCLNPWLFVIAMNGSGSAYGLYLHPRALVDGVAPWVYWEHEDDTVRFMATETDRFFRGLMEDAGHWAEPMPRERASRTLTELGVQIGADPVELDHDAAPGAPWLPPIGDDLEDVGVYLAMRQSDPDTAELGLLGHAMDQDPDATEALEGLYEARGWSPPRS